MTGDGGVLTSAVPTLTMFDKDPDFEVVLVENTL